MSIPQRIKVIGQKPAIFGEMVNYLTVGKEYDVDPDGYCGLANNERVVCIIGDNGIPTLIAIVGPCAHGGIYEVVA